MNATMPRSPWLAIALLIAATSVLGGCVGAAVGAGATAATAAAQERGFSGAVDDTIIRAQINDAWLAHDEEMFRLVNLQVQEGRALLTGRVPTQQMRLDAVRLAWQADGLKEVINEIVVTDESGLGTFARDTWISTQLKTAILFDRNISSINYSIETVNGVVYLMGVAQSPRELELVTNHARNIEYVKRVVSYVRMKNDPSRQSS